MVQPSAVYEERLPFPFALGASVVIGALAVMMAVLLVLQVTGNPVGERPAPDWFYLVMFVFLSAIALFVLNFRALFIGMTPQEITVAYGCIRRTVPWGDIEGCFWDESPTFSYGGWGIRITRVSGRWRLVYNLIGSPVVILRLRSGRFREFGFSTRNPEQVLELVRRQAAVHG